MLRGSEIRKTKDAITLLDTAISEWETEMDRSITFEAVGAVGGTYDIESDGIIGSPTFNSSVNQNDMHDAMDDRAINIWTLLVELEASKNILSRIHPDLIQKDDDGTTRAIDAWGSPIGIVFPCGDYKDSDLITLAQDASGDLTVRDQAEDALGSCLNKRLYLVSPGPDTLWGYRYQANPYSRDDDTWSATLDNVTSYEPFVVEDAR